MVQVSLKMVKYSARYGSLGETGHMW